MLKHYIRILLPEDDNFGFDREESRVYWIIQQWLAEIWILEGILFDPIKKRKNTVWAEKEKTPRSE